MYTEYIIKKKKKKKKKKKTKNLTRSYDYKKAKHFIIKKNTLIGYIKIDVRLFFFKTLLKVIITAVKTKLTLGAKLKLKKEKHRQKSQHTQCNSGFIQKQTGMCLTWSPRRLLRILSLNVFQT